MTDPQMPKIMASARQGWEHLDVKGTIEEVVEALVAKDPAQIEVRPMMPTKDLREVWAIHRGRRVGLIVSVSEEGAWVAVKGVLLHPWKS